MVIKIKKKGKYLYKSSKSVLLPKDIKQADEFDIELNNTLKKLENYLIRSGALTKSGKKKESLKVWYEVGRILNKFFEKYSLEKNDEIFFWQNLYEVSGLLHKGMPSAKINLTRNDFKTATLLAKYPLVSLEKVGSWALWRELLSYKNIIGDERILKWVIKELIKKPRTRDGARPLLKAIANRFYRIDARVLSDTELSLKIKEIKIIK